VRSARQKTARSLTNNPFHKQNTKRKNDRKTATEDGSPRSRQARQCTGEREAAMALCVSVCGVVADLFVLRVGADSLFFFLQRRFGLVTVITNEKKSVL
jgi:hypothetical protein